VNELLCFINFHFGKVPKNKLITTLNGFYSDEELKDAKDLLFGTFDQMSPSLMEYHVSDNGRRVPTGVALTAEILSTCLNLLTKTKFLYQNSVLSTGIVCQSFHHLMLILYVQLQLLKTLNHKLLCFHLSFKI